MSLRWRMWLPSPKVADNETCQPADNQDHQPVSRHLWLGQQTSSALWTPRDALLTALTLIIA